MTELMNPSEVDKFTVVTWNILLDKTRSAEGKVKAQVERIGSHIRTLKSLNIDLDVVCLQEVEETSRMHHGEAIAWALKHDKSFWFNHNTSKRSGEYIGMFGKKVEEAESFDVGHDKRAVITFVGQTAVVGIHHRNEKHGPMRADQMRAVLYEVRDIEQVAIVGDANAVFFEKSRRMLHHEGFQSAFHLDGKPRPRTFPTDVPSGGKMDPERTYREVMYNREHLKRVPPAISLDIFEVRGLGVETTGIFEGDSDHYGLYATVVPPA